jgi:hypothetical protein
MALIRVNKKKINFISVQITTPPGRILTEIPHSHGVGPDFGSARRSSGEGRHQQSNLRRSFAQTRWNRRQKDFGASPIASACLHSLGQVPNARSVICPTDFYGWGCAALGVGAGCSARLLAAAAFAVAWRSRSASACKFASDVAGVVASGCLSEREQPPANKAHAKRAVRKISFTIKKRGPENRRSPGFPRACLPLIRERQTQRGEEMQSKPGALRARTTCQHDGVDAPPYPAHRFVGPHAPA